MDLYSQAKISPSGKVNKQDLQKWVRNLVVFTLGVVSIYAGSVILVLQSANHVFSLRDFIPNQFVQGSIALYVFQGIQDFIRKFRDGKK